MPSTLGAKMIAVARRRLRSPDGVTFHVGRFEDMTFPEGIVRGGVLGEPAFHWLDARVSWPKGRLMSQAGRAPGRS